MGWLAFVLMDDKQVTRTHKVYKGEGYYGCKEGDIKTSELWRINDKISGN